MASIHPRRSRRLARGDGGMMRGGDGHSRLFLFLVAFALLVFASTVCLLAAGLAAAHAGDGEVAEGAAGGPAHAWQQPEQPRAPAPIPVPASGTGTVRGPPARIGARGGGGRTAAEGTPPGAIAAPRLVGGGGFAPVSSDAAGRGGLLPPAPAVVPRLPAGTPDHLSPAVPPLPPFQGLDASEGDRLVAATLSGSRPTVGGVHTILQRFLLALHRSNRGFQTEAKTENDRDSLRDRVVKAYFDLATEHLVPLDKAYRGRNVFPVREDGSIFMSLASFRDHLLGATLKDAFRNAEHPDKIYIGAVVQNCFGDEYTCRTGAQVVGKDRNGRDMTKVSDAPPDKNGVEEFCSDPDFRGYCEAGQVRALYVNETESLGPAVARYYASKLWGGENYYFQADAHLRFAKRWDTRYIDEIKAAKSYPMAVLSSYPPGFSEGDPAYVGGTTGSRLCTCTFSTSDVEEHIIRINTGSSCSNHDVDGPTQIPFIAAGFFFARGEFLKDVPFDPFLPWCFMGEEIALSSRAWTSGWDIYAPRENLIAHQYRPGKMGLPKFWGSVGRLFGRPGPGFNTRLQKVLIRRVKSLVGYPEVAPDIVREDGFGIVLRDMEHYGMGNKRTLEAYHELTNINIKEHSCGRMAWCNKCEKA